MPNLLAHVFTGLVIARALGLEKKSVLLFGSILPDIKIFVYLLATPLLGLAEANSLIIPIHSPFGALLLAVFFASLFPAKEFKGIFALLAVGVFSHFVLDILIYPFYGIEHYLPVYPFSWTVYGLSLGFLTDYLTFTALLVLSLKGALTFRKRVS